MSTDTGKGMMSDLNDHMVNTSYNMNIGKEDKNVLFANEAASGSMMEVELAKLAQKNAASADVKAFAKMIETDHSKANSELKSITSSKNISLPTEMMPNHKKHIHDLSSKRGKDFDKAYIEMMVQDHQEDISKFNEAAQNTTDEQLRTFAIKTLPVLQKHLDRAKSLQGKM